MARRRSSKGRPVLILTCLSLLLSTPLWAQRSDRAVVSGVVTDAQGAAIPGATVTVANEDTGVEVVLTTNSAGAYSSNPLVLGRYTVKVALQGFKTAVTSGIQLDGGDVARRDVTLEVGEITETVEVVSIEGGLSDTRPDVSHKVDAKYYKDLPIVTAADTRLAESVLQMQPGYLPMTPNGDPMFRGSQFNSRINGGQTMSAENVFDGGAFGYASGHQQSHESQPPVEAIAEVNIVTTTYSAEYGHTSGGFIEYTSKSGTNQFHGSAYGYLASESLNTSGFFDNPKPPLDNKTWGVTLGGPIVKNKTFFFLNADWTRFRSGTLEGFGNTVPIDAFRNGDFSALLGGQVGTDALGRPVFAGQIFNPATTRLVNGVPVRDPYPGNIIPPNDPLLSNVASVYTAQLPSTDRAGIQNNVAGNPAGDQTWELDSRNILGRIDHNFSPSFRMTVSGYYNNRPSVRNCGGVQGCDYEADPLTDSASNTSYVGEGFTQRIYTTHIHSQFDWIISNNLMSHSTVAWDQWYMGGASLSAGASWPDRLWGSQQASGLLEAGAGPPQINFGGGGIVSDYNTMGLSWPSFGFEKNNRWQFSTDLTWVKGKSTVKLGMEYRRHSFPQQGWAVGGTGGEFDFDRVSTSGYDAQGNNFTTTGDSYASFLLGQVFASRQTVLTYPTWQEAYLSPWINAEFKVSSNLTLTAGLRLDYQTARTEQDDNYSSFVRDQPNPGAGGLPGVLAFAGTGAGRTGSRTFESPSWDAWGPRAGFAYRIDDKTMVRGGYGMYYAGVAFSQFTGNPNQGFQTNPSAVNTTNGVFPAHHLDQGFPTEEIVLPPSINPTLQNGQGINAVEPTLALPRFQNWSVTLKRQVTDNLMLDVSYIGNKGSRLNHHSQRNGLEANMNDPSVLALGAAVLGSNINSPLAQQAGFSPPYPGFNNTVAQSLRRYPQYTGVNWRGVPLGRSLYNALELVLEQRVSRGLHFRLGYTFSRLKNNGAESAQGNNGINGNVQDPVNWDTADYGLSIDDTPHVALFGFTWDLPDPEDWSGAKRAVLGGWNISGIARYESGRPLRINMNNDLGGFLFNGQKRPNRTGADAIGYSGSFDPASSNYFNSAAWEDPGPLTFGNAPFNDGSVRGFSVFNADVNFSKTFAVTDAVRMRFEAMFGNIFNTVTFCGPNTNFSSGAFGTVNTQCNQARSAQFGLRVDF